MNGEWGRKLSGLYSLNASHLMFFFLILPWGAEDCLNCIICIDVYTINISIAFSDMTIASE